MKNQQVVLRHLPQDFAQLDALVPMQPQLLLVFGCAAHFANTPLHDELQRRFPAAIRIGCSTAGEISTSGVESGTTVVTAVVFDRVQVWAASTPLTDMQASMQAGSALAEQLRTRLPAAVLVYGQGVNINGSAMIEGMSRVLGPGVPIAGGLAGDDAAFQKTWTLGPDGITSDCLVALGLSGAGLVFASGSFGGWKPFGPARKVTRSLNNCLFELDGEPALDVYKRYLGSYAEDLPGSGLLFPFEMLSSAREPTGLIRTILGIDEPTGSLVLAGAIDQNSYLRLMHAQTDGLVEGAEQAARTTLVSQSVQVDTGLAILVSCVGRKLVMGGRVEEEIEAVQATLGNNTLLTGFYSYGEISPGTSVSGCQLHNQTMTIAYLAESDT